MMEREPLAAFIATAPQDFLVAVVTLIGRQRNEITDDQRLMIDLIADEFQNRRR